MNTTSIVTGPPRYIVTMALTTLTLLVLETVLALCLAFTTLMGYYTSASILALLVIPICVASIFKTTQALKALSGWSPVVTRVLMKVGLVKPMATGGKALSLSGTWKQVYMSHNLLVLRHYDGHTDDETDDRLRGDK
jgi:hypothetical protein